MLDLTYIAPADFGRYALQSDGEMDDRPTTTSQKSTPNSIPPLMSLSVASTSVVKENIEPLPFPQQSPGPIRRPTKLPCSSNLQASTLFSDSMQSPGTPDVLAQINHLLDHQNSINLPTTSSLSGAAGSSTLMQDISSPSVPWTPFMPADWSSKYEATWPMGNMPSPDISLTSSMPNPFAVRASTKEGTAVWPTALGTATPRSTPLATRAQPGAEWNGLFPSAAPPPPSTEPTKSAADTWSKFLPAPESPSPSGAAWWPKPPSDEATEPKDQSRWDFAN